MTNHQPIDPPFFIHNRRKAHDNATLVATTTYPNDEERTCVLEIETKLPIASDEDSFFTSCQDIPSCNAMEINPADIDCHHQTTTHRTPSEYTAHIEPQSTFEYDLFNPLRHFTPMQVQQCLSIHHSIKTMKSMKSKASLATHEISLNTSINTSYDNSFDDSFDNSFDSTSSDNSNSSFFPSSSSTDAEFFDCQSEFETDQHPHVIYGFPQTKDAPDDHETKVTYHECHKTNETNEINSKHFNPSSHQTNNEFNDAETHNTQISITTLPSTTTKTPKAYKMLYGNTATKMYTKTQQWRQINQIPNILSTPHRHFDKIKSAYPHYLHGNSKRGYPVVYEQPGRMNLHQLLKKQECDIDHMIWHYIFFLEYLRFNVWSKPELQSLRRSNSNCFCGGGSVDEEVNDEDNDDDAAGLEYIVVLDMADISLSHLSGNMIKYMKQSSNVNSKHYPMSVKQVLIINAPYWYSMLFTKIQAILPENIPVLVLTNEADGGRQKIVLREWIDEEQIPREFGGCSEYALGEHPFEMELKHLVKRNLEAATQGMCQRNKISFWT